MELNNFLLFAFASLMLNITPGADMLYVATRSAGQGTRAGILSSLGIMAGCMIHIIAAVTGLSIILAQSALAFSILKYSGAAYLVYLAIRSFLKKENNFMIRDTARLSDRKILAQGMVTNILNPKVALFFLAFLPQFIKPGTSNVSYHILFLGLWFNISGTLVNIAVAVLFGRMRNRVSENNWFMKWQPKITAFMLFILGLKIALTRK